MSTKPAETVIADGPGDLQAALILQEIVPVLSKPKGGILGCQLRKGVFVPVLGRLVMEGVTWLQIPPGWISSLNAEKNSNYEIIQDLRLAVLSWEDEDSKRKRMASAIASELVKSYPLPKVKRFVNSLLKHAQAHYPSKPMVKINKMGMEDIMISLGGQMGLSKQQLFEYVKVAASQQSNPPQAVLDIVSEVVHLCTYRPTQWVIHDMNVLETDDIRRRNDRFVMLAASGKLEEFKQMVEQGQELTCLHSELKYTALHGAADFGQTEVVAYIVTTGVSLDMRDPRKQQTALHIAAHNGRHGVIKTLLAANANRMLTDRHGFYPYMYADMQGSSECRELLKYLPPPITDLTVTDFTISSISVSWRCPTINPELHSEILEHYLDCLPADITPAEEAYLTPVPTSPALPPPVLPPGSVDTITSRVQYIYQKYVDVTVTQAVFTNLTPATAYRIRGKCLSLSGWSDLSVPVVQQTLAYVPKAPEPVDICKISTNGLLLSWRKPWTDNGMPIDSYQIELVDARLAEPVVEPDCTANESAKEGQAISSSGKPTVSFATPTVSPVPAPGTLLTQQSTNILTKRLPAGGPRVSVSSRFHRLIKHKNLQYLHKYLTGLEPQRPYQVRVRAHNSLGFSPWSGWTGPIAPQVAVTIAQFNPERMSATLTWFAPILSHPDRHVEAYELQMCCLRGPLTKSIELLASDSTAHLQDSNRSSTRTSNRTSANNSTTGRHRRKIHSGIAAGDGGDHGSDEGEEEDDNSLAWIPLNRDEPDYSKTDNLKTKKVADDDESNEYVTLRSDLRENRYEVTGLKAGSRYRCRVRCKISDYPQWNPWDFAIASEIFSMPATPPDPPFFVRVAVASSAGGGRGGTSASASATMIDPTSMVAVEVETGPAENRGGATEFIPRDSVPMASKGTTGAGEGGQGLDPTATATATTAGESTGSIFDYALSDLIALATEEDEAVRAAAEAERERLLWEQAMFGEDSPRGEYSGEPTTTTATATATAAVELKDTLLPILMDSAKIRERVSRKMTATCTGGGLAVSSKRQSVSMVTQMFAGMAGEDMESELESVGCEDLTLDSRSVAALAQSVTSSAIARKTDVDIKSGKYTPGKGLGLTTTGGLEGSSLSTTMQQGVEGETALEITHDSITISWQNGQANGLPVDDFIVEMARVRTYRLTDVVRAREAYQNVIDDTDHDDQASHDGSVPALMGATAQSVTRGASSSFKPTSALEGSSGGPTEGPQPSGGSDGGSQSTAEDCWAWQDITNTGGRFVGSQRFRAEGLIPGATYIFRLKQHNACGWSPFSGASRMIATYPSVPPGQPIVFSVRSTLTAVRWAESAHPGIGLTNIEYEVQIGAIPNVLQSEVTVPSKQSAVTKQAEAVWRTIDVRYFPSSDALLQAMLVENVEDRAAVGSASVVRLDHTEAETASVHVMLHRLVPHVTYVLRVRVRTIVGWSPWSAVSAPFRMKG